MHHDAQNITVTTEGYSEGMGTHGSDGYLEPVGTQSLGACLESVGTSSYEGYLEPVKTHRPKQPVPEVGSKVSGEAEASPEYAEAYDHMPGRKSEHVYHEIDQ